MAEGTTIKADQIEGLPDLIRAQVREVLREEVKSAPEDMDQLRRSPAGTMIRLEEQVKALDTKIDQRFEVVDQRFEVVDQRFKALDAKVDQRFDVLKSEMDQRFEVVDQRFEVVDQRFKALDAKVDQLRSEIDRRFNDVDRRFNLFQWVLVLNFSLLIAMAGKLFLMK